jgi:hypothetical protein
MNSVASPQIAQKTYQRTAGFQWISKFLITLVLFLLPFERLMLPLNTKIVDFALIIITLFSGFCLIFIHRYIHLPLIWSIWIILFSSVIATITGLMHPDSYMAIVKDLYIFIWFIALTNVLINQSPSDLTSLMKIWCLVALVEAGTSILGMLGIGPKMFFAPPTNEVALSIGRFNRAIGTYLNPNALAVYLTVSFFLILATNWSKFTRLIFCTWILAGIFATGSLGAMTSTLGSLFLLIGVNEIIKTKRIPKLWTRTFILVFFVSIVLLLLFILAPTEDMASNPFNQSDIFNITVGRLPRSFSSRMNLIKSAWPIYSRYPLGTGPETFNVITGELHNDYIAYLFERGPLGLMGWFGVIGTIMFTSFYTAFKQENDRHRWRILAFGMGFLACAINSLSHEISHFRQVWVFIAFLFAVSHHLLKPKEALQRADKRRS